MRTQPQPLVSPPDSELGLTLKAAQASGDPVIVDTGETRYTLYVAITDAPRDVFADYDPQTAVAGLRALNEALSGIDRAALLRDLDAQREQDSHGRSV
ncbi:MAG: hypothetical protein U0031_14905 [Thermomicrobiales bacterium]